MNTNAIQVIRYIYSGDYKMNIIPVIAAVLISLQVSNGDTPQQQPISGDRLLTLSGAVQFAVDSSITMRSGRNTVKSAYLNVVSTKNALYPSASAGFSAKKQIDPSRVPSAGASVGINYDFNPSRYPLNKESGNSYTAAEYNFDQKKNDLAVNVIIQYIKILCAADLITVEEKNLFYQEHKSEEINALFERGVKSRADVLQQQSTIAQTRLQLLNTQQEFRRSKLILLDMIGMPLSDHYIFDSTEVSLLEKKFLHDSSETDFTDIREREEITAQKYAVAASKARLQSYRLAYIPSLGLSAGWSASGAFPGIPEGSQDITTSLQVGASLSIPLFDNKKRWLQVKNAELSVDDAKLKLEELQQSTDLDIAQAALEDAIARDRVTSNSVRVATAREALAAMEERYAVGASTLTELNTAQSDFSEAQSALIQSQFDRTISRISLLHETGHTSRIYQVLNIGSLEKRQ